ncbi:MAG TPA: tetratricopeptide repeat protein [Pyrinomonadaceae bacterium]|jgi:Tfp pilus assembly protein PilF
MRKRTIITITVAFILTIGFTALWSAEGDEREGDTATNIVASSDAPAGQSEVETPKKKGNRFGRFFKAPFKAVGKIFGGGSKDGRPERMTEKDAERFESVGVMRVEHRTDRQETSHSTSITARDYLDEGRAALESGQLNEAIAALSRATSLEPRLAQAHSMLAVAYDRKGLRDRARSSYDRAIDINNNDAQALNNFGYSLYLGGNYRAAAERLKRAARLAPDDKRILNNLALAQCRLGKYDDAYKNFARAGGEFDGRMNVAALLERMGRDEDALKHYEAARRLQPSSVAVLRRLSDLYQRTGRQQESDATRQSLDAAGANQTAKN